MDGAGEPAHFAPVGEVLARIERRLERIEAALERVPGGVREAQGLVAAATDTFDDGVARLARRGVDVDARLRGTAELLERLTAPETVAAIERALELSHALPGVLAAAVDTVDGVVGGLAAQGVDVDERLHILWRVAERLTAPEALEAVSKVLARVDEVHALLDSGVFEREPVEVVGLAASSLAGIGGDQVPRVGPWGAWRALSDPDVQRSLGAALEFARRFGKGIDADGRGT